MKKSLLALIVSSTIFLSACEDKEKDALTAQVSQRTQEITQLKTELENAKTALEKSQTELLDLKMQVEKATSTFPALMVEIETFFNKKEVVKHKKDPNAEDEYFREETPVHLGVTLPKTNVEWLNNLLLDHFIQNWGGEFDVETEKRKPVTVEKGKERETAVNVVNKVFNNMLEEAKENPAIAYTEVMSSRYQSQRNNIVVFSQFYHSYSGGAHGMYRTEYLNVDTNKRAIIKLSDLLSEKDQTALKETLWNHYVEEWNHKSGDDRSEPFTAKSDIVFSDEFYLSDSGVTFVYPPYALGPFVMGEVELTLSWEELNQYLPKEYQQQSNDIETEF